MPNRNLHPQSRTHQIANGAQLITVKMNRHQQQHLPETGRHATGRLEIRLLPHQPLDPLDAPPLVLLERNKRGAGDEHAQTNRDEAHARGGGARVRGEELDDEIDLLLLELDSGDAAQRAVEAEQGGGLHHLAVEQLPLGGGVDYDLEAAQQLVAELLQGVARDFALFLLAGADEEGDPVSTHTLLCFNFNNK